MSRPVASPPFGLLLGAVADSWYIFLASVLRRLYFSSVRVVGVPLRPHPRQIVVCSHRNGAIDGYLVMAVAPRVRFLISAQLLRSFLLRLMFHGIPVVREKDRRRHGMRASQHGNPILAACRHVRTGGSLAMFPEGTSEWGPHPQPYETGTARIVRMLLEEHVDLEVIPVGSFFRAPDRFRSAVEMLVGEPVALPARGVSDRRDWERRIHESICAALNAVSPNCPDMATFERVERLAAEDAEAGASYAYSFKHHERQPPHELADAPRTTRIPLWRLLCGLPGLVLFAPAAVVAWLAGRKADARNTVTFFRIAGGFAASLVWLPVLFVLLLVFPLPMLALIALAVIGWPAFRR